MKKLQTAIKLEGTDGQTDRRTDGQTERRTDRRSLNPSIYNIMKIFLKVLHLSLGFFVQPSVFFWRQNIHMNYHTEAGKTMLVLHLITNFIKNIEEFLIPAKLFY